MKQVRQSFSYRVLQASPHHSNRSAVHCCEIHTLGDRCDVAGVCSNKYFINNSRDNIVVHCGANRKLPNKNNMVKTHQVNQEGSVVIFLIAQ